MQRVVVVGGGVLGMMHAASARQRGYQVVQLELRARELWEQLAAVVPGIGFRPHGSLTLAADDAEAALLRDAADLPDACQRGYQFLDAAAVRAVNPALRRRVLLRAALHQRRDRRAPAGTWRDPRLPACRGSGRGYAWLPGREAVEIAPGAVRDHTGTWHPDLVILCPGAAHTGIAGPHLSAYDKPPVRRGGCRCSRPIRSDRTGRRAGHRSWRARHDARARDRRGNFRPGRQPMIVVICQISVHHRVVCAREMSMF
jgi:glycine/D-amino acid oxidase-like deaminating enzyme